MLLFMMLKFCCFFSDEQFSIILAFFESEIFCLSILMFLIIRVCCVSDFSGSLFCNGSQIARKSPYKICGTVRVTEEVLSSHS